MTDQQILLEKTLLTGLAGWYLFGTNVGIGAAAINVGIHSICTPILNRQSWLQPNDGYKRLGPTVKRMAKNHLFWGFLLLGASQIQGHSLFRSLRWTFQRGSLRTALGYVILHPIAKGIFFRGFVQENIGYMQSWLQMPTQPKKTALFQAAFVTLLTQSSDPLIRIGVFGMALMLGYTKDIYGIHASMLLHGISNGLTLARALII